MSCRTSNAYRVSVIHIVLILLAGTFCYLNTFSVPFIFDDYHCIVNNPAIRGFDYFPDTRTITSLWIHPDIKNNFILRPMVYFTFALNYSIHGYELFGYHLVNLLFHLASSLLLYLFAGVLASEAGYQPGILWHRPQRAGNLNSLFPLAVALTFVCHPIQTQAVTYIVQRFVPMATCFYLASLVLYAYSHRSASRIRRWCLYSLALIVAIFAMESKEIAFTLPVMMMLFDFMYLEGRPGMRIIRLTPFVLTMAIIPAKLLKLTSPATMEQSGSVSNAINLVNFGGTSSLDYLMTQFGVITTYIRLLFVPVGQNFDYDYPLQHHFFAVSVIGPLSVIILLLIGATYLLARSGEKPAFRLMAFGVFWFFITLSVESSVVPIEDLIYEHRVYLPSAGFFVSIIAAFDAVATHLAGRHRFLAFDRPLVLPIIIITVLAIATIARNSVWRDEVGFWRDVVAKSPGKGRAHLALGEALLMGEAGEVSSERQEQARKEFIEAVRLAPSDHGAHLNLSALYERSNNIPAALRELEIAIRLSPSAALRDRLEQLRGKNARP